MTMQAYRMNSDNPCQVSLGMLGSMTISPPLVPRSVRFLRFDFAGPVRLKVYGIATQKRVAPRSALVDATLARARECLARRSSVRSGFVIADDATTLSLGAVYTWNDDGTLDRSVYAGPLRDPAQIEAIDEREVSFLWHDPIVDFERRTWQQAPDLERYMRKHICTDV